MSASQALVFPVEGGGARVYFPIYDITGDPVATWTGKDRLVSFDGAAPGTSNNNIVEVGGGLGYIEFDAEETDGIKCISFLPIVTNANAKPKWVIVMLNGVKEITDAITATSWGLTNRGITAGDQRATDLRTALEQLWADRFGFKDDDGDTQTLYEEGTENINDDTKRVFQRAVGALETDASTQVMTEWRPVE